MSKLLEVMCWGSLICLSSLFAGCDDDTCADVEDPCDVVGELRCSSNDRAVEVCSRDEDSCLTWSVQRLCPGATTCVDEREQPRCECVDECDRPGLSECADDIARFCRESDEGCLYWFETNCGLMDQSCVMASGIAECVGDCESNCFRRDATRCGSELEIETCTEVADGCLRWTVTEECSETEQVCNDSGEDARCVEVCISACDEVGTTRCSETDDIETCVDPGSGCLIWELSIDCDDEQVCEERRGALGCFDEVACDDGIDDDGDGSTDCDDEECFGVDPECVVERNCRDDADNDLDSLVDCDDEDCAGGAACVSLGVWELFHVLDENDLEGCTLVFSPDEASSNLYSLSSSCACRGEWLETPGRGDASTAVTLGNDDSRELTLSVMPAVSFYEQAWLSLHVGSNGFVTFGASDADASASTDEFFAAPRIAPLDADLDPSATGTITVDEWIDRVAISFDGVAFVDPPDVQTSFQVVIDDAGTIRMVFLEIGDVGQGFVGIANGVSTSLLPEQRDFLIRPLTPTIPGDIIFTEVHFDPSAADDAQGEYIELANLTSTDLELACCLLSDDEGTHELGDLTALGESLVVLARSDDPTMNGGLEEVYAYGDDLELDDVTSEVLTLECGGVVIDEVSLDGAPWPAGGPGVSMQLSSLLTLGELNDEGPLWCDSTSTYGTGDLGTPGSVNQDCEPGLYIFEDCEDDREWTTTGDWEWGRPSARYLAGPEACADGSMCFGTNMDGEYTNDHAGSSNVLILGPLDLSHVATVYLRFELWLDTEPPADGLRVVIADRMATMFASPVTAPSYNAPEGDPSSWSGDFGDPWFSVVMDMTSVAGEPEVYVFWELHSDSASTAAGAYVDSVEVIGF